MFELKFDTGNAAFHDQDGEHDEFYLVEEVVRILGVVSSDIQHLGRRQGSVIDFNGNKVGEWRIT